MIVEPHKQIMDGPAALARSFILSLPQAIQRQHCIDELKRGQFDLLVIGGGITGAGISLDATLRGLRVALIEKGDFASGTSGASSKLIHGGLRYLELAEFRLVREALHERHTLLRLAPHLVRPLRMLLPHYPHASRPRWMMKLGMSLYDWMAGARRIGRHRWLTAGELTAQVCGLRDTGLRGGYEFFDAQMDDTRLCLEVVLTGVEAGARVANYLEAVEIRHDRAGRACGGEVMDRISGESFGIAARRVVNAAGPWLDEVCHIDDGAAPEHLAPTKGVHIVLPSIGLSAGLLVTHPDDGRVMFLLPWMNRTLVGTTDTFFDNRPDDVAAEPADVAYLLAAANHYLNRSWSPTDVLATLAGLRPLLRRNARNPSNISREFTIFQSRSGLWSIGGGKYTTYRSMAERMVDMLIADLGGTVRETHCHTAEHRLIGTPAEEWNAYRSHQREELSNRLGLAPELAGHLLDRYGCRARLLAEEFARDSDLLKPIIAGEPEVWAELHFQSKYELANCAADHLLRRTRLGLLHPELLTSDFEWPIAGNSGSLTAS